MEQKEVVAAILVLRCLVAVETVRRGGDRVELLEVIARHGLVEVAALVDNQLDAQVVEQKY